VAGFSCSKEEEKKVEKRCYLPWKKASSFFKKNALFSFSFFLKFPSFYNNRQQQRKRKEKSKKFS
jgi:hypothetical protein